MSSAKNQKQIEDQINKLREADIIMIPIVVAVNSSDSISLDTSNLSETPGQPYYVPMMVELQFLDNNRYQIDAYKRRNPTNELPEQQMEMSKPPFCWSFCSQPPSVRLAKQNC